MACCSSSPLKRFVLNILFLFIYIVIGVALYTGCGLGIHLYNTKNKSITCATPRNSTIDIYCGTLTHAFLDGFYFAVVSALRIGYGDVVPAAPLTKAFAAAYVLAAAFFLDGFLNMRILNQMEAWYGELISLYFQKAWIRGRWGRLVLAGFIFAVSLFVMVLVLRFGEGMSPGDAIYTAVVSATTAGYGDKAFRTVGGRIFATVWLPVCTFSLAMLILMLSQVLGCRKLKKMLRGLSVGRLRILCGMPVDKDEVRSIDLLLLILKDEGRIDGEEETAIKNLFTLYDTANTGWVNLPLS